MKKNLKHIAMLTFKQILVFSFVKKLSFCLSIIFLTIPILAAAQPTAKIEPIALRTQPLAFIPKEFYILDVKDVRADRQAVAYLLTAAGKPGQPAVAQAVDLQGGTLAAVRQFIRQGLPRNPELRPVIIRLKECSITETAGPAGRVDGKVLVVLAFDIIRSGKTVHTLEYRGGARYSRPIAQFTVLEPTLRQSLTDGLQYLNTWMDREADRTEKLAQGIKIHFTDYTRHAEADTVFYSPNRPLTWKDFRAEPRASVYAAAVLPSFAYEGRTQVINGIIHIYITMKVFVVPEGSWAKENAKDAYALNHEQRHFDIVKLIAEHFKQRIQPKNLTIEDYNSIIQYEYLEAYREMNKLQNQYDNETQHGIDQAAQTRWNQKIDDELRQYAVKK